jgi:hypothetical protein
MVEKHCFKAHNIAVISTSQDHTGSGEHTRGSRKVLDICCLSTMTKYADTV